MRRGLAAGVAAAAIAAASGCAGALPGGSDDEDGDVVIEFSQWWESELPDGKLRALMDEFEARNPGIQVELLSGPYASMKEQVIAGAAARMAPDVVGLDGAWVNDFAQKGVIADLSELMDDAGYDDSNLVSQTKVDGSTYMIPAVNFVYPMFTNDDLLAKAGVDTPPRDRSEFMRAAKRVTALGGETHGWTLPLSLEAPNGVQNDVMSWVWASGGSMLDGEQPNLVGNPDVSSGMSFVQDMWDAGVVAPGSFTMKEQDKVEEFSNGRVGMMIDSLAHVDTIREANPDLDFSVSAIPAADGYSGKRGIPYASWGLGVSDSSEHKAAAFKLVQFLMGKQVNADLASAAHAFPGNNESVPDFVKEDEVFSAAFDIYRQGRPENEFTGMPVAEQLMRDFSEELQRSLDGQQSMDEALEAAQERWEEEF
ncbi:sugar ABC transporter substrate-binding protein [Isoptericola sp. F-RaC21]|uniref:ABC transporter substrate-binding protein n=1 Tax=Isoptericola sp. F-RaC21 TaxID=3141452 RepID=UPI00315BD089